MHRRPRLFCAAERSALPGGGVVLCGVIRLCGAGRSALPGGGVVLCGVIRLCGAGRSALPGGGVVLCGVIRLCGVGRSALRGGFSLAFCGRLRYVRSRPVGGAVQGRGIGFAARLPPVAGADGRCGRQDGFRVRCLLSCGASCLLLPASCFLLPASCLLLPASCLLPPSFRR